MGTRYFGCLGPWRFKIGKLVGQMYRKRKNSETGHLCSMAVLSSNEEKAGLAYEVTTKIKNAIVNLELAARDILGTESTIRLYENTSRIFGPVLICINELHFDRYNYLTYNI